MSETTDQSTAVTTDNATAQPTGIFLGEQVFGANITNSDGKKVSVRDIGEQHVVEYYRGKFIPTGYFC